MTPRDAATGLLHVVLPTTATALKTAFRRRAMAVHPDRNPDDPGACGAFVALQDALNSLLEDPTAVVGVDEKEKCDDGTPLSELGKGLGPTTNGRPCPSCRGAGYTSYRMSGPCPDCQQNYIGLWRRMCARCRGTGRYVRDGREIGECFACRGQGWVHGQSNGCRTCSGLGRVDHGPQHHARCRGCDGTGEIRVLNPVLPKGLFTTGGDGR